MKSPYGRRGSICAHFGWSWEYLHHGIAWPVVQRIMSDLPYYEYGNDKEKDEVKLNKENAQNIMSYINSLS